MSNDKLRKHNEEVLIEVYEYKKEDVEKMTDDEIGNIIIKKQKQKITNTKNPNKFWIINGLPDPKEHKTTTSKYWGALIVLSLFLVLAGFAGMFMWMAYR